MSEELKETGLLDGMSTHDKEELAQIIVQASQLLRAHTEELKCATQKLETALAIN